MEKFEKNIFLDVIGYSPTARVIDLLIEGRHFDYSLTDIAENARVGWTNLHPIMEKLLKNGIIVQTRNIGKAKMFQINKKNSIAQKLIELDALLIEQTLKEMSNSAQKHEKEILVKHK